MTLNGTTSNDLRVLDSKAHKTEAHTRHNGPENQWANVESYAHNGVGFASRDQFEYRRSESRNNHQQHRVIRRRNQKLLTFHHQAIFDRKTTHHWRAKHTSREGSDSYNRRDKGEWREKNIDKEKSEDHVRLVELSLSSNDIRIRREHDVSRSSRGERGVEGEISSHERQLGPYGRHKTWVVSEIDINVRHPMVVDASADPLGIIEVPQRKRLASKITSPNMQDNVMLRERSVVRSLTYPMDLTEPEI
ncbi:unnamed protein product [Eruca vesicaria subsp. sativa]|uniref:Uncharacterized protein n=1 Tax=Eruca vesicaria subsp. sativa TaxID=29727 RepID=A0ABC8LIM3_ERUVS|nr:unnamed protein product [Eruca vesicaria subsp. sativa]